MEARAEPPYRSERVGRAPSWRCNKPEVRGGRQWLRAEAWDWPSSNEGVGVAPPGGAIMRSEGMGPYKDVCGYVFKQCAR